MGLWDELYSIGLGCLLVLVLVFITKSGRR